MKERSATLHTIRRRVRRGQAEPKQANWDDKDTHVDTSAMRVWSTKE